MTGDHVSSTRPCRRQSHQVARRRLAVAEVSDTFTPARLAGELIDAEMVPSTTADTGATALIDVTHDSREAGPGVLFAARPGAHADGHDFAAAAVESGSPALLVQRVLPGLDVPQIVVPSVAQTLGYAADLIHGRPTRDIAVLGVTGTNGKTTTVYMLDAILRHAGHATGVIGTVETRIGASVIPGVRTTPEASELHRLFAQMRDQDITAAAMEVSSHGLVLGRLNGVQFCAALFTNLTQDHLDFHRDMEDYYQAKARLFTTAFTPVAVVTIDDEFGARLAHQAPTQVWTLSRHVHADVWTSDVSGDAAGSSFTAHVTGHQVDVHINLPGDYNVTNALGALATAFAAGIDLDVAAQGLTALAGVPGRMERVAGDQPFEVVVDYAHTPDSVQGVLRAVREVTDRRLIVVLGCGGDRDRGKRPAMAQAAVSGADVVVFTSDNPRNEDPEAILDDMVAGLDDTAGVIRVVDRNQAIHEAIAMAGPGDVVVLAGKGHEPYQELASGRVDFDDRAVARDALRRWGNQ